MRDVHVVHREYRLGRPYGCTQIRLIRPLTHPQIQNSIRLTHGTGEPPETAELVIVERLPPGEDDTLLESVERLRVQTSSRGVPLVFTTDDNLLDLHVDQPWEPFPSDEARAAMRFLARVADGILVSTEALKERFAALNARVSVVPNAIDERLFGPAQPVGLRGRPFTIGYMGTYTHLKDLRLVLRPLRQFLRRRIESVKLEVVGVGARKEVQSLFEGLPVRWLDPGANGDYEAFPGWMRRALRWDAAIAPLSDDAFTRSKSDLKYVDYGALGIPGLFSDVRAYRETVRHRETGLLVANDPGSWLEALEEIESDEELRLRMALAARDDVYARRTLATNALAWPRAIAALLPGFFDRV